MARKTGNDYKNEYRMLLGKQDALSARVSARLLQLCKQHPDAVITQMGDTDIKAKSIASENYIKSIELSARILCIEAIENWLASQHPFQQGKLFK